MRLVVDGWVALQVVVKFKMRKIILRKYFIYLLVEVDIVAKVGELDNMGFVEATDYVHCNCYNCCSHYCKDGTVHTRTVARIVARMVDTVLVDNKLVVFVDIFDRHSHCMVGSDWHVVVVLIGLIWVDSALIIPVQDHFQ